MLVVGLEAAALVLLIAYLGLVCRGQVLLLSSSFPPLLFFSSTFPTFFPLPSHILSPLLSSLLQALGGYQQLEAGGKEEEAPVEELEGASYGTAAAAPKGRTFSSNIGAGYAAARCRPPT